MKKDKDTLVYVGGWTVQKSLLHELKLQKIFEKFPSRFPFPISFKIQVDSFLATFTVLEN